MPLKIFVDASPLTNHYRDRGVGQYVRCLLQELLQHKEISWVFAGYGDKRQFHLSLFGEDAEIGTQEYKFVSLGARPSIIEKFAPQLFVRFKLNPLIKSEQPDLFFGTSHEHGCPPLKIAPSVVAIHDLIPHKIGKFSQKNKFADQIKRRNYYWALETCKRAKKVVTLSEVSKQDLVNYGFTEERVDIIPIAVPLNYSSVVKNYGRRLDDDDSLKRRTLNIYNITEPYIFYIGGLEANKNVTQLIHAFALLESKYPDLKLVIGGGEFKLGWDHKATALNERARSIEALVNELKLQHRVIFTGFIEGQHLPVIHKYARVFVHLSEYEGFGLAPLEPQLIGTPVVASDRSTYPEVLGDSALLVDPSQPVEVAQEIGKLLGGGETTIDLRARLAKKGKQNAESYNWKKTGELTFAVFTKSIVAPETTKKLQSSPSLSANQTGKKPNKTNKRAAIIAAYFHPFRGGMEKVAEDYGSFLVEEGYKTKVFTSDRKQGLIVKQKQELHRGLDVTRLRRRGKNYYVNMLQGLTKELKKHNPSLIHVHGFGFMGYDQAIWRLKRWQRQMGYPVAKVIATPHGPFMSKPESGTRAVIKTILTRFMKLYLPRLVDQVIAVNPYQAEWITDKYGFKSDQIVTFPPLMPQPPKNISKILAKKEAKKSEIQITSLTRITEYKGLQDLVAAFNELNSSVTTNLVIAGATADYVKPLQSLIKKSPRSKDITLELDINEERKWELLDQTDIFVLGSEWEAFGIVIAEAMSRGAAVVSTRTEGGNFLVKPGENGELFDYHNLRGLVDSLNKLLNNTKLLRKYGANSTRMVQKFSEQSLAQEFKEFISKL